jgi:hypothetical protein
MMPWGIFTFLSKKVFRKSTGKHLLLNMKQKQAKCTGSPGTEVREPTEDEEQERKACY